MERVALIGDNHGNRPALEAVLSDIDRRNDAGWAQPADHPSVRWCRQEPGAERLAWLGGLPFRCDVMVSVQRVRLVHASLQSKNQRVLQSAPLRGPLLMFESTDLTDPHFVPGVVGFADTHTPFVRAFSQRTLVNIGSV